MSSLLVSDVNGYIPRCFTECIHLDREACVKILKTLKVETPKSSLSGAVDVGPVVSVLPFCSDDPSTNPAEVKNYFKGMKNDEKRLGDCPFFKAAANFSL